jgi:hypothetical protein
MTLTHWVPPGYRRQLPQWILRMFKWWFGIKFWKRVVAGFVLGALAGWAFGPNAEKWFGPLGDVYVNLIMMIAVPLVFFAVINAVASLAGQKSIAALAGRTFAWFALTAVLAVGVGLAAGYVFKPGLGVGVLKVASDYQAKDVPGVLDMLFHLVPPNPFAALSGAAVGKNADGMKVLVPNNGTVLQVIFFAGLVGFALVKLGEKTAGLRKLVGEASELMIQVTRFVLEFTPIGTFGLIAALVGGYGFEQLKPLLQFVLALYAACAFQVIVVYTGLLLAHGLNPVKFFRGAFLELRRDAGIVALRDPQPRRQQGLRRVCRPAGRHYQDGWLRRHLPGAGCRLHRPIYRHPAIGHAVRDHRVGIGAGQFRHCRRTRYGGDHGNRSAERGRPAPARHRLLVCH